MNAIIQQPLFTQNARKSDPQTSIDAARKVEREGTVARHERLICEALAEYGPMTSKEIAEKTGLTSVEVSRRSTGLMELVFSENAKPPRCQYTDKRRNGCAEWELIL